MRNLLAFTLILLGLTSLNAATFLERFNSLEQDIQSIQDDVQTLKDGKGGQSQTKTTNLPASSSEDVKALKDAIKELKKHQKKLENKIQALQKSKGSHTVSSNAVEEEDDEDDDEIQEQLDELNKALSKVRKFTNGNHLKLTADFRTAVDNLKYVYADGTESGNDGVFTNRLWINMKYKATPKISFTGQLAYYKTYGAREGRGGFASYDDFDWITNETANDGAVRLRKAYFFYANETFLGTEIPWTFSVGRRPSTNGHLINYRDDDKASSPLAHAINVEFDGLSSKFDLSNKTGIPGFYFKLCMGRGLTNASEALSATPYATDGSAPKDIDLAGAIISLYNNGQYSLTTQSYIAKNLIDLNSSFTGFEPVGDLASFTANFTIEGIGEDGEPFLSETFGKLLDETTFFISYAASRTDPYEGTSMLGSPTIDKNEIGRSFWVGLQLPTISEKGRWGIEYNKGDQYWRSITYAEDTLAGSKIAVRGEAYEIYFTEPFANNTMSWQLRYTYIDYKYSGSNGFFGNTTGTSTLITDGSSFVDKASDLRFYLRYRY